VAKFIVKTYINRIEELKFWIHQILKNPGLDILHYGNFVSNPIPDHIPDSDPNYDPNFNLNFDTNPNSNLEPNPNPNPEFPTLHLPYSCFTRQISMMSIQVS
jgi:hypothetical protein